MNKSLQWRSTGGEKLLKRLKFEPRIMTRAGIIVRTNYEKRIANYLFINGIEFIYEKKLIINDKTYYPDFYIPKYELFIEFFGWSHIPSYERKMKEKFSTYSKLGIKCIYLYLKGSRDLEKNLEDALRKYGVLKT